MRGEPGGRPGLVAISLAALLTAAGCGGSTVATGTSPLPTSATSPTPAVAAGSGTSPVPRCEAGDLAVTLGAVDAAAGGQHQRPLVVTNRSPRRCAVTGYPGVRFVARDGSAYDVVRSPLVRPGRIDLPPGANARANLTYLATEPGDSGAFLPARVLVTPPDTFTAVPLSWDGGSVLDQSGATHPGTYITAFTAG
ncbi:DUF4232 domain-containing protein [Frankia sp. AiPs1]|uniref:DUF4232 domain-containing protein n=1 Tax=Frankia sp. AiPs1 TaxID=573493 RepID=UPI0020449384|nr:DUF4232 domain-containing protein [Frankia sp. AiPs1]MCM3920746.1 DUF4232 domain-containing protein [Frankia sp. AiPs1]